MNVCMYYMRVLYYFVYVGLGDQQILQCSAELIYGIWHLLVPIEMQMNALCIFYLFRAKPKAKQRANRSL